MEQTGGKWMSLIGAYMIVKGIVNLILGFSVGNIVTLLISGVLAFLIIKGVPYMNYVTGAYLALMSVIHIIPNIQGQIRAGHIIHIWHALDDQECEYTTD
jgi:hypothetical protein